MFTLYYCNPHELVGGFDTLDDAKSMMSRDYCMYIKNPEGIVVHSTARETPEFMVQPA